VRESRIDVNRNPAGDFASAWTPLDLHFGRGRRESTRGVREGQVGLESRRNSALSGLLHPVRGNQNGRGLGRGGAWWGQRGRRDEANSAVTFLPVKAV